MSWLGWVLLWVLLACVVVAHVLRMLWVYLRREAVGVLETDRAGGVPDVLMVRTWTAVRNAVRRVAIREGTEVGW